MINMMDASCRDPISIQYSESLSDPKTPTAKITTPRDSIANMTGKTHAGLESIPSLCISPYAESPMNKDPRVNRKHRGYVTHDELFALRLRFFFIIA
jgi:hypothetical protein